MTTSEVAGARYSDRHILRTLGVRASRKTVLMPPRLARPRGASHGSGLVRVGADHVLTLVSRPVPQPTPQCLPHEPEGPNA